jgi:hypothetical protein
MFLFVLCLVTNVAGVTGLTVAGVTGLTVAGVTGLTDMVAP